MKLCGILIPVWFYLIPVTELVTKEVFDEDTTCETGG